jgi:fumarylacetoacetate (FAA) hydrolase
MASAAPIAATLQSALEQWDSVLPRLQELYEQLNAGAIASTEYIPHALMAPLPRAWQWLDASAFPSHGELMQRAFELPPIPSTPPLMYQGLSHQFLGPTEDVPFGSQADGIDFEGEFGVITGPVGMGTPAARAAPSIRLAVQVNDWSLRTIAPIEMKTGFGWIQAKPACSMAPIAVSLDELDNLWSQGRITATLKVELNGKLFGEVPASDMQFGFHELIAHAARTRSLCAGTILGSGTISSHACRVVGSCCIAEKRAIEMIDRGAPRTDYLQFGDRVTMNAFGGDHQEPLFGTLAQQVISAKTCVAEQEPAPKPNS